MDGQRVARVPVGPDAAVRRPPGAGASTQLDRQAALRPTLRFRTGPEARPQGAARVCAAQLGVAAAAVDRRRRGGLRGPASASSAGVLRGRANRPWTTLGRTGEPGIVLVGRPYNIHDAGVNLSVARKLRDYYGVNCSRWTSWTLADVDIRDINDNMFWDYGRKILAAAKLVGRHANLHIIYITNFKCGPDSFLKDFIRAGLGQAVPDAPVRRPQQRRRHDDPLRGVPGQQGHPAAVADDGPRGGRPGRE